MQHMYNIFCFLNVDSTCIKQKLCVIDTQQEKCKKILGDFENRYFTRMNIR